MSRTLDRLRRPEPVIFVIVALLCAAVLVVYLQHRALVELDRQTNVVLQKVAEQTATTAALEIRRTLGGPRGVLGAVNHPLIAAGRLDLVANEYAQGMKEYPQVERFFVWSELTEATVPGEALFYGGAGGTPAAAVRVGPPVLRMFYRDPPMGRRLLARARQHGGSQRIYAAVHEVVNGTPYDVFFRLFYTDAGRTSHFAVLGFVVNLDSARTRLFPALYESRFAALLNPRDGSPPFEMRVLDESGRQVFGPRTPVPAVSARSPFAFQFYPAGGESLMAASIPPRRWDLIISPRAGDAPTMIASTRAQSYWLSALSVLLMFVALAFALQSHQRSTQLARMQADFVAHVSHQLKTPVSMLSAVAETVALERVRSPEKLTQCVEIIRGQTSRLSALIERILEFSRVDDGGRRYELETVPLATLVRETADAFAGALETSGYRIAVVESGPAPIVAADPAALEQALVNLLDNAVKYSGESRTVTVRVGVAGGDATIEVVDAGVGIDPAERGRIFERFYRGEAGALHRHGFGLGLAIARDIVVAHRGTIEVESARGAGSTFRIRIPMIDRGAARAAARAGARLPSEKAS